MLYVNTTTHHNTIFTQKTIGKSQQHNDNTQMMAIELKTLRL